MMKKVIIAEDIKAILERDQSFFNRSDIRAIGAASGEEILALHRAEKAHLIIANLDMPKMKGEDLCSLIRADETLRNVSIIIACSETAANLQRCTHCGANAFLATPINHAVLLQEAYQLLHVTPRRACRIPLKLSMEGTAGGKPFSGEAENISAAGMLLRSAAVLFEGDTVNFSFSLPGSKPITATAEIVRVLKNEQIADAKNRYGIVFSDMSDNDISVIDTFVRSNGGDQQPLP
jgi:CheY-like chemotaxis protein